MILSVLEKDHYKPFQKDHYKPRTSLTVQAVHGHGITIENWIRFWLFNLKLPNVWVTLVSKVSFNFEVFSLMMPVVQYYDFLFSNLSCSNAWGFNSRENNALLSWAYLHISFLTACFKVKAIKHISGKHNDFLKILISSHLSQIFFLWLFLDIRKNSTFIFTFLLPFVLRILNEIFLRSNLSRFNKDYFTYLNGFSKKYNFCWTSPHLYKKYNSKAIIYERKL